MLPPLATVREPSSAPASRALRLLALAACLLCTSGLAAFQALPDTLTLRIIVVGSADEAGRVVEQLERGENFVALAQRVSLDPSADTGGLLGRIALSSLRPELRAALHGVGVGRLSSVVPIPTGFAIVKVVADDEAAGTAPLMLGTRSCRDPSGLARSIASPKFTAPGCTTAGLPSCNV